MNKFFKIYNFSVDEWPGQVVMQSGYPLCITSADDFYQIPSTNMVATETTLAVYDTAPYKKVTPQGLFSFVRGPVSNRLAKNGREWTQLFGMYNSGTYNNQWMVVDFKEFTPGLPLGPDTLWVAEQMPGYFAAAAQTQTLEYGYFPSYNQALFPATQVLVGMPAQANNTNGGTLNTYDLAPRATIFRRDGNSVASYADAQKIIRYNNYKNDPLSSGNPGYAIASRYDLQPPQMMPQAFGATDAKMTNSSLLRSGRVMIQAGPTHDQQPVFCWSTSPDGVKSAAHAGQNDCWDFPWVLVDVEMPCGLSP
jgi:hypothetical protein